jgi:multiple sugar transport system ATP-binding protein
MPLSVDRWEFLSGELHVYGTVSRIGEPTRVVARLPATVETPVAAGETREFAVPTRRLRFFDSATGQRSAEVRLESG